MQQAVDPVHLPGGIMPKLRRLSGGWHVRSTRRPVLVAAGVAVLLTVCSGAFAGWTAGGSGKAVAWTAYWTGTDDSRRRPTPPTSGSGHADTTAPTTNDDTALIGDGWSRTEQAVTLRPHDRGGSGVAATYFTTDGSIPTTASSRGRSVRLGEGIHVIRYFSVDHAGNREHVETAAIPIRVDQTAPSAATLVPLPEVVRHGQVLTGRGDDALSGVARVVYELCADAVSDAWTAIGSSTVGPDFALVWRDQPPVGSYQVRASVLDAAGNATVSASQTVRVQNTKPAVTRGTAEAGDKVTAEGLQRSFPSASPRHP
jgi:hypothetical protein